MTFITGLWFNCGVGFKYLMSGANVLLICRDFEQQEKRLINKNQIKEETDMDYRSSSTDASAGRSCGNVNVSVSFFCV